MSNLPIKPRANPFSNPANRRTHRQEFGEWWVGRGGVEIGEDFGEGIESLEGVGGQK